MNNSAVDPAGICAHAVVERQVKEFDEKHYDDVWKCCDCRVEFFQLPSFIPGEIRVMEPQATLRDQFAMAAMQADALSSAVIAAAYIAQGKRFSDTIPGPDEHAREYYKTADVMMKAREG